MKYGVCASRCLFMAKSSYLSDLPTAKINIMFNWTSTDSQTPGRTNPPSCDSYPCVGI